MKEVFSWTTYVPWDLHMTDKTDTDPTDTNFLGCCVVSIGRQLPTFRMIVVPVSSLSRKTLVTITPMKVL